MWPFILSVSRVRLYLIIITIIAALIKWRSALRKYWQKRSVMIKFSKTLPGPKTLPIFGNALELLESDKSIFILTEISRRINAATYRFWLGPALKIFVADPRDVQIIFSSPKASKKDNFYDLMRLAVNNGLINSYGHIYKAHKKLFLCYINNNFLMKLYTENFNKHARILVQRLEEKIHQPEFNMQDYFELCIGDVVFETIYGLPGTAQKGEVSPFFELADVALHITFSRFMQPWLWPDFTFFLTAKGRKCRRIVKEAHDFIDAEIVKLRARRRAIINKEIKEESWSIFDMIVDHVEKTGEWTDQDLRDEIVTLYIAAHDTLVGVGSFVLLMLAMHPEVQEKTRDEINQIVGNNDVSEEEIANLKYLEMVIKETVRLFPVGGLIGRKTTEELKLATCTVPKDCSVDILIYALHRDPKYWENPEIFNPERFTPENSKNRHPYAYIPFSGGMRSCPGSRFAFVCLKVIIFHVLRVYELKTTKTLDKLRIHSHISTRSIDGFPISLTKLKK